MRRRPATPPSSSPASSRNQNAWSSSRHTGTSRDFQTPSASLPLLSVFCLLSVFLFFSEKKCWIGKGCKNQLLEGPASPLEDINVAHHRIYCRKGPLFQLKLSMLIFWKHESLSRTVLRILTLQHCKDQTTFFEHQTFFLPSSPRRPTLDFLAFTARSERMIIGRTTNKTERSRNDFLKEPPKIFTVTYSY